MPKLSKTNAPLPWKVLALNSFIGAIFLLVNFPKFVTELITSSVASPSWQSIALFPVNYVQSHLVTLIGPSPEITFQKLMSYNFLIFLSYLLIVTLFALRHRDWALLGFSIGGLFLGYSALHLISWLAIIIVSILSFVVGAVGWIFSIIALVIHFIITKGWWLLLILGAIAFVYIFKDELIKILFGLLITGAIGFLLYKIVPPIWRWIMQLITPIIEFLKMVWEKFIGPVLGFIFGIILLVLFVAAFLLGIFFIFTTLGRLVVDQIRAAWYSGTGRKGVALGGFAIGSALALIILTSVAAPQIANGVDIGWNHSFEIIDNIIKSEISQSFVSQIKPTSVFVATMPKSVETFVFRYLTNAPPPIVDSALFFAITIVAVLSVTIRVIPALPKIPTKVPVSFLPQEYFAIFGGLLLAVVVIFAQAFSEGES
jgi:hypothetical protein